MEEIWKNVVSYEGLYKVSNLGNVAKIHPKTGELILKKLSKRDGYLTTGLTKGGKTKSYLVHRLVAVAFLENESVKPYVNHIDGNRANNNVNNLEWVTPEENTYHAIRTGLMDLAAMRRRFLASEEKRKAGYAAAMRRRGYVWNGQRYIKAAGWDVGNRKYVAVTREFPNPSRKGLRIAVTDIGLDENNILKEIRFSYSGYHTSGTAIVEVTERNPVDFTEVFDGLDRSER